MKVFVGICCFTLLLAITARAEIEKYAIQCENSFCFYWWPKLPEVKGWHQDKDESYHYSMNAMAPDGSSFVNAEAIMYAKAIYKPRVPETKSLTMFISDDSKRFSDAGHHIVITEVSGPITGDGTKCRSYTFFPKSKGNWEQVTYMEEGDYYLAFVLSSRSKDGFAQNQEIYLQLIAQYKVNPQRESSTSRN